MLYRFLPALQQNRGQSRLLYLLRVPVHKYDKKRGKGRKFDFAHNLMVDSLGYDKNYCRVFLAKYSFISKKYANYQSPLKSSEGWSADSCKHFFGQIIVSDARAFQTTLKILISIHPSSISILRVRHIFSYILARATCIDLY